MKKCKLNPDFNNCPHFQKEKFGCNYDIKCSFQVDDGIMETKPYEREERWYEKYHKGTRRMK